MSSRDEPESAAGQRTDGDLLEAYESNMHPFVLKIWLEETASEAGRATWRGHITHVPSGERRYLKDLDGIISFVLPYLGRMGVRSGMVWRARRWLKRRIPSWLYSDPRLG